MIHRVCARLLYALFTVLNALSNLAAAVDSQLLKASRRVLRKANSL